ncbi:MAG: hypothetical protein ACUVQ3_06000, partial [bacterium]
KLGRRFIGIDIDPKYVEITNKKLKEAEPTIINGCYVSNFLDKVITVRDKDWAKIKRAFFIPKDPLELEKGEIYLHNKYGKRIQYRITESTQSDLFSLCGEIE